MDNKKETKNVQDEIHAFLDSRDVETAAKELKDLENEFESQLSAYVERIAALANDPRYRILLPLARGGIVIAYSAHDHTGIQGTFGCAPGIGNCMKSLVKTCDEEGISALFSAYEAVTEAKAKVEAEAEKEAACE